MPKKLLPVLGRLPNKAGFSSPAVTDNNVPLAKCPPCARPDTTLLI